MADKLPWNDDARAELRETLQRVVTGELRLAKYDQDELLELCREAYIQESCPDNEKDEFVQFAEAELERAAGQLEAEMESWPEETDCDRLDRVEEDLRQRGILLWQASPCCDTCTGSEIPHRIDDIDDRSPGFGLQVRGYAFFIEQNLGEQLAEQSQLSLYLAYGWLSPEDEEVSQPEYELRSLTIAREVCDALHKEGFEVDWNGDFDHKIGLTLNWQRRSLLE